MTGNAGGTVDINSSTSSATSSLLNLLLTLKRLLWIVTCKRWQFSCLKMSWSNELDLSPNTASSCDAGGGLLVAEYLLGKELLKSYGS